MPEYIRLYEPGATYFFTVVTHRRRHILTTEEGAECLREAWRIVTERFPFETQALCVLPDHVHCLWKLPPDDCDFSTRWRRIKTEFSRRYGRLRNRTSSRSLSRKKRGETGFWQRRFWEHKVRNEDEFARLFDYVHFNPVKHEYTQWPEDWAWSTFHKYVRRGWYDVDWGREGPPDDIRGMDLE